MKTIDALTLGFGDAENYLMRQNRNLFNHVFIKNRYLDQILEPTRYFIIGDKGTGKTAYSAFLANNRGYKDHISHLRYVRETEYAKFIRLKNQNNLDLSDYSDVWSVILLFLFATVMEESELIESMFSKNKNLKALRVVCEEFYEKALAPEISHALRFVERSKEAAGLVYKSLNVSSKEENERYSEGSYFQTNLSYLQREFISALRKLKIKNTHLLFIDGIDIRPGDIPYADYLECVKGLAHAVWHLNNDVFPSFRDSVGRFRIVMLARPDIFNSLNLQNAGNKIRDNAVYLDWNTSYCDCENSDLFRLSDKILSWQQNDDSLLVGDAWHSYFPWTMRDINLNRDENDGAFVQFLKLSYCRPRDIVLALGCLQATARQKGQADICEFPVALITDASFKSAYSESLMMGIKDQLSFYYTEHQYQLFRNFFLYLHGQCQFTYKTFEEAFSAYKQRIPSNELSQIRFLDTPESFLQFLYDMNVLSSKEYTDRGEFFRWCYRERSISNPSPQVEIGSVYVVHYGLQKALRLGNARRIDG